MVHYKLNYFDARGAGEIIRQIFKYAEQDFEDHRIPRENWENMKNEMPFGQMPVLEVDGKKLPQSFAIARYLARQFGLAGKNAWEEALVDAYADQYKDFMVSIIPFFRMMAGMLTGDIEKEKAESFEPAVKKHYTLFAQAIKSNPSGYLVGDGVTWIDLLIAEMSVFVFNRSDNAVTDFPEVKAHQDKIHAIPQIKKWRETRPETNF